MNNNKFIILASFLIIPFAAFGQSNEWDDVYDTIMISHKEYINEKLQLVTDTIISQPFAGVNYLVGTTFLKGTYNQIMALEDYGISFEKIERGNFISANDIEDVEDFKEEITSIEIFDTLLKIKFNYWRNSLHDLLCDFEITDDKILNLTYFGYGSFGFGDIYTFLTCFIRINKKYAEKDFSDIKYVMLNGDKETLRKLENFSK